MDTASNSRRIATLTRRIASDRAIAAGFRADAAAVRKCTWDSAETVAARRADFEASALQYETQAAAQEIELGTLTRTSV